MIWCHEPELDIPTGHVNLKCLEFHPEFKLVSNLCLNWQITQFATPIGAYAAIPTDIPMATNLGLWSSLRWFHGVIEIVVPQFRHSLSAVRGILHSRKLCSFIMTSDYCRVVFRFEPNQWETGLLCNDVSHWLGANIESALYCNLHTLSSHILFSAGCS